MGVVGSALGAIVNIVLPEPILIAVQTFSLILLCFLTGSKVITMCRDENKQKKEKQEKEKLE